MEQEPITDKDKSNDATSQGVMWWATLIIAILAVPSFGVAVASIVSLNGLGGIAVFILACWLCTYLGMRLMANPKMSQKLDVNKKPD